MEIYNIIRQPGDTLPAMRCDTAIYTLAECKEYNFK